MDATLLVISIAAGGERIILKNDECDKCGGHQVFVETGKCVPCFIQENCGLSINLAHAEYRRSFNKEYESYYGQSMMDIRYYHHDRKQCLMDRKKAEAANKQIYHGTACNECGCNLRKTSDRSCLGCHFYKYRLYGKTYLRKCTDAGLHRMLKGRQFPVFRAKYDRRMREFAAQKGITHYRGLPCDCGRTNQRYTTRGQCVACVSDRNKKPAPARTEAGDFDYLFH